MLVLVTAQPAAAQVALPDGPGKDQMIKVCGLCHEAQRVASIRLTRDGWEATIDDMVARGARGTDEEFQAVLDYLSTHFLGEAERPLNVNTAQAIDFETVLLLLRKEAAAMIAYRREARAVQVGGGPEEGAGHRRQENRGTEGSAVLRRRGAERAEARLTRRGLAWFRLLPAEIRFASHTKGEETCELPG